MTIDCFASHSTVIALGLDIYNRHCKQAPELRLIYDPPVSRKTTSVLKLKTKTKGY